MVATSDVDIQIFNRTLYYLSSSKHILQVPVGGMYQRCQRAEPLQQQLVRKACIHTLDSSNRLLSTHFDFDGIR